MLREFEKSPERALLEYWKNVGLQNGLKNTGLKNTFFDQFALPWANPASGAATFGM